MKFSVAMSVYKNDNAGYFRQALKSVFNQTVQPDEVVLVVDGFIDENIKAVISEFPQLKVVTLEKNMGHGFARKTAMECCSNEIIALMDSDDISMPERFEKQLKCFDGDEILSVCGGQIKEFIGEHENIVGIREVKLNDGDIHRDLVKRCPFNQITVMLRRSYVINAGGYLDWYCEEDYYLWIRMHLIGAKFKNLPDCLCMVRVGNDMYRRRGGVKYFKSEAKLQRYMLNKGIISPARFCYNVAIRLIVQVLLPNRLRGIVFRRFARR